MAQNSSESGLPESGLSDSSDTPSAPGDPPPTHAPGAPGAGAREFAAFISYSHTDIATARWLHRAIETYRVPRALVGQEGEFGAVAARLRPVFRDEDELAGASALGPKLEGALAGSRALLVVCSPAARRSTWVDSEIRTFKRLNPGRPVFAVIAAGVPGDDGRGCFPEALLWEIDPGGDYDRRRPVEPLAPDLQALDRRIVKLKVIAGLLGVPFDSLHDREQRRRRVLTSIISIAALVLIAVLSGLTIAALSYARIAVRERNAAERERKVAIEERDHATAMLWAAKTAADSVRAFQNEACPQTPHRR